MSTEGTAVHKYLHLLDKMLLRVCSPVDERRERIKRRIASGILLIQSKPPSRFDTFCRSDFSMPDCEQKKKYSEEFHYSE